MVEQFDKHFWEEHWRDGRSGGPGWAGDSPPNPYLAGEIGGLPPGTALDAGCGRGADARWLAARGWRVTAVDISAEALTRAAERAAATELSTRIQWVEADLGTWTPSEPFDLVTTHYAHPAMPQLDFYDRIATWVAPGGTLLIVGHLDTGGQHSHGHGHQPPAEAVATAAAVTARLEPTRWRVVTADERHRQAAAGAGHSVALSDVVVRATRVG